MSKVFSAIASKKNRPLLIGGAVIIGGVFLFIMLRGGGGSAQAQTAQGASGPSEALQAASIQAQTQLGIAQLQANAQTVSTAAELQAFMYGKDADTNVALAQTEAQRQISLSGIQAQQSVALAGQETQQYSMQVQLGIEQSRNSVELERIKADVTKAGYAGSVEKAKSKNNLLGGVVSTVGSLFAIFSDERAKKNFEWVGIREYDMPGNYPPAELNIYEFEYVGEWGPKHRGMIAQDIAELFPSHVMPTNRGNRWLAVDYDAL